MFAQHKDGEKTVLEWLKAGPRRHSPSTLAETLARIEYLKGLTADAWDLNEIPIARQRAWAHALLSRPASESRRRKDARQTLEVVCFLRITLLELTDAALFQTGRRISDLMRQASGKTQARQARSSAEYRERLVSIREIVGDQTRTAEQRLAAVGEVIEQLGELRPNSHAATVRETLADDPSRVQSLLKALQGLEFKGSDADPAMRQLSELRKLYEAGATELPAGFDVLVAKPWKELVDGEDRGRAKKAFEASTALALRRSLRRGSIWIDHSLTFRERDQMVIPSKEWETSRERHIKTLGLPEDAAAFYSPIVKHVEAGLVSVAEAVKAEAIEIGADGMLHLPKLGALHDDVKPQQVRDLIYREIGDVQLPDLLMEVDAHVNFSEILLGRRPKDAAELLGVYAGLLAQGSEYDAKSIASMMPQIDGANVGSFMRLIEMPGRLMRANQRVTSFQQRHSITELWGKGKFASSDAMSIDTSRHLFNARVDPKRRTYGVGIYTHILNSHGIVHNQPVVLNERQAGPAIEGAVRYNESQPANLLSKLAVDTHGYTNVGMTISKMHGIDLCPRLKDLSERRLFIPRGMKAPEELESVVVRDISFKSIDKGWDELLRVVASIKTGRVSAAVLMQRLGSAAQGDLLHRAADQLGRLLRTLYLCDYLSNPEFRREIHTVLNRGESVHLLQRAVYTGKIAPERGRRRLELIAISGAHALLTNIVIAWNTHRLQSVAERWRLEKRPIEDEWLARMAPTHFRHINFRGQLSFGIERFAALLLNPARLQTAEAKRQAR